MTNKPKNIGTAAESAVVKALRKHGFPHAERRALAGVLDLGDITGCPGIVWEVKGGEAAKSASDAQVEAWLDETERERQNAGAQVGILVLQRRGIGHDNAHRWWAVQRRRNTASFDCAPMTWRTTVGEMCAFLLVMGYGGESE